MRVCVRVCGESGQDGKMSACQGWMWVWWWARPRPWPWPCFQGVELWWFRVCAALEGTGEDLVRRGTDGCTHRETADDSHLWSPPACGGDAVHRPSPMALGAERLRDPVCCLQRRIVDSKGVDFAKQRLGRDGKGIEEKQKKGNEREWARGHV